MFSKILIANRGEIAVRIIRACKEMGIKTVAIYSEADQGALHVALADESYCVGPFGVEDSYLNMQAILSVAFVSGAQAIHPGYGFLSENAEFARMCEKHGLVFIGPDAECMKRVCDKSLIKQEIAKTDLEVIPGTGVLESVTDAVEKAARIGYPVVLKSRSGGGGKGIRLIRDESALVGVYDLAVAESAASFGDSAVYLEKLIHPARHIEVQILADEQGNIVCLGERDCSIQRHNQKLVEETPSPAISDAQRKELFRKVTDAVSRLGYKGVGTLEFLYDKNGRFWFLEMNVRLQVEHGITEMLFMADLVKWQIRIGAGIPIVPGITKRQLTGTALECRINALAPGTVDVLHVAGGPNVRFDTYLYPGCEVSPFYDSLIGKLMVFASSREEAIRKMKAALCEMIITGIPTNIEEQLNVISNAQFTDGSYDLTFMEMVKNDTSEF